MATEGRPIWFVVAVCWLAPFLAAAAVLGGGDARLAAVGVLAVAGSGLSGAARRCARSDPVPPEQRERVTWDAPGYDAGDDEAE